MITWHVVDGWLAIERRSVPLFSVVQQVGGIAAPIFFASAGASTVLASRSGHDVIRHGLRLIALGYILDAWSWSVDCGALADPRQLGSVAGGWAAVLAMFTADRGEWRWALASGGFALPWLLTSETQALERLLRLDILHGLGAAIVVIGATRATSLSRNVLVSALAAGLAAELSKSAEIPWLTGGAFPLFPWLGYALLGACGARMALEVAAMRIDPMESTHSKPPRSPLFGDIDIGVEWPQARAPLAGALELLGRQSLTAYVVHLPFAYGLPVASWKRAVSWSETALALFVVMAGTCALCWLRESGAIERIASRVRLPSLLGR